MEFLTGTAFGIVRFGRSRRNIESKEKCINGSEKTSSSEAEHQFRSTRAIALGTSIAPAKVIEACYSYKSKIRRNKLEKEKLDFF